MAKSKIFISGATGATGGATARQLLKQGHAIRVLAHREDDRSKLLQDLGAEVVYGDLLDIHSVTAAFGGVRAAYFVGSPLRPENNPSRRMADPLEIAKLAVYLASDDSAYVVGADFLIDGGVTAISAVGA